MINNLHNLILSELERSGRADTVFVVCAVLFDILVLGVNSAVAGSTGFVSTLIFSLFFIVVLVLTISAILALKNAEKMAENYHQSLTKMYQESGVIQFYPSGLDRRNRVRKNLYLIVVFSAGFLALVIPSLVKYQRMVDETSIEKSKQINIIKPRTNSFTNGLR